MAKKTVAIKAVGAAFAALDDFIWFQGELKYLPAENYEKLKKSIIKLGFSFVLNVWINEKEELILIDGHQRVLTLKSMRGEGWTVPFLPYAIVEADSYQQAKEKVLAGASQYGEVQHLGVSEFLQDVNLSALDNNEMFALPGIDFERLPQLKEVEVSEHTRSVGAEINEKEIDENITTAHECPSCGYKW